MAKYWIVVAESSRARIFSARGLNKPVLTEVEDIAHPEGRLHEGDLVTSAPGAAKSPSGQGRHAMDDETTAKKHESIVFAKQLAERLESGRNKGKYEQLMLVSPPGFLGLLRDNLSIETRKCIAKEVNKNFIHDTVKELQQHLAGR